MKRSKIMALLLTSVIAVSNPFKIMADDVFIKSNENREDVVPEGIPGMPDDYEMTDEEIRIKQDALEYDLAGGIEELIPGIDYVENEVICQADSREDAEQIALAYGGYLKDYGYRVATIGLENSPVDVVSAVKAGIDPSVNLPAVAPNGICIIDPVESALMNTETEELGSDGLLTQIPVRRNWQSIYYSVDKGGYGFNDPALNPENEHFQWMHEAVNSYAAWGVTTGSSDITVAVIDSGVYENHEDLAGKVTTYDVIPGTKIKNKHGTHVAGIIAAHAGNGKGGAGIAPGVKILSIDVFEHPDDINRCEFEDVAKAVNYVAGYDNNGNKISARHADIINMSLGGMGYNPVLHSAIDCAYREGITICASRGNENSNALNFPSTYDHVIGVTALNENFEKAGFSCFGPYSDIGAPGVRIYSTSYEYGNPKNNDYTDLDGTSMACPVVAGACALYMSEYGHVDPDTMEAVIKKSAKKAGSSGIGAGMLDIAMMFEADTEAPVIRLNASGDAVEIIPGNFSAGPDASVMIIYSLDGKAPSFKNGEIVHGEIYTGPISVSKLAKTAAKSAQMKISALAVTAMGTVSKTAAFTITVDPDPASTDKGSFSLTGAECIFPGGSGAFKAGDFVPADIAGRKLKWSVTGVDGAAVTGISVSDKGIVKVDKSIVPGSKYVVRAALLDDEEVFAECGFAVIRKADSVRIMTDESYIKEQVYKVTQKNGSITSLRLYTADIDDKRSIDEHKISLTAEALAGTDDPTGAGILWTTSNANIVSIEQKNNDVILYARGKGMATITGTAQDGSGKKAQVKVSAEVPVSYVSVMPTKWTGISDMLAYGKSMNFKAACGSTYGSPTKTAVNWDYELVVIFTCWDEKTQSYYDKTFTATDNDEFKSKNLVKIKNGKLTVPTENKFRDISSYIDEYGNDFEWTDIMRGIKVIASTTDGTEKKGEYIVKLNSPTQKVGIYDPVIVTGSYAGFPYEYIDYREVKTGLITGSKNEQYKFIVRAVHKFYDPYYRRFYSSEKISPLSYYTVTSSDTSIASGKFNWEEINILEGKGDYYDYTGILYVCPHKKGTVKFTLTANDGTGKKCTFKVIVK